jgi:hypothetical protein
MSRVSVQQGGTTYCGNIRTPHSPGKGWVWSGLSQQRLILQLDCNLIRVASGPGNMRHDRLIVGDILVVRRGNKDGLTAVVARCRSSVTAISASQRRPPNHPVPRGRFLRELFGANEELLESLPKLARHAAVNREINAVAQSNAEIGENYENINVPSVDNLQIPRVLCDENEHDAGQRQLHGQENKDHGHLKR